jgi:hypothetical protein
VNWDIKLKRYNRVRGLVASHIDWAERRYYIGSFFPYHSLHLPSLPVA